MAKKKKTPTVEEANDVYRSASNDFKRNIPLVEAVNLILWHIMASGGIGGNGSVSGASNTSQPNLPQEDIESIKSLIEDLKNNRFVETVALNDFIKDVELSGNTLTFHYNNKQKAIELNLSGNSTADIQNLQQSLNTLSDTVSNLSTNKLDVSALDNKIAEYLQNHSTNTSNSGVSSEIEERLQNKIKEIENKLKKSTSNEFHINNETENSLDNIQNYFIEEKDRNETNYMKFVVDTTKQNYFYVKDPLTSDTDKFIFNIQNTNNSYPTYDPNKHYIEFFKYKDRIFAKASFKFEGNIQEAHFVTNFNEHFLGVENTIIYINDLSLPMLFKKVDNNFELSYLSTNFIDDTESRNYTYQENNDDGYYILDFNNMSTSYEGTLIFKLDKKSTYYKKRELTESVLKNNFKPILENLTEITVKVGKEYFLVTDASKRDTHMFTPYAQIILPYKLVLEDGIFEYADVSYFGMSMVSYRHCKPNNSQLIPLHIKYGEIEVISYVGKHTNFFRYDKYEYNILTLIKYKNKYYKLDITRMYRERFLPDFHLHEQIDNSISYLMSGKYGSHGSMDRKYSARTSHYLDDLKLSFLYDKNPYAEKETTGKFIFRGYDYSDPSNDFKLSEVQFHAQKDEFLFLGEYPYEAEEFTEDLTDYLPLHELIENNMLKTEFEWNESNEIHPYRFYEMGLLDYKEDKAVYIESMYDKITYDDFLQAKSVLSMYYPKYILTKDTLYYMSVQNVNNNLNIVNIKYGKLDKNEQFHVFYKKDNVDLTNVEQVVELNRELTQFYRFEDIGGNLDDYSIYTSALSSEKAILIGEGFKNFLLNSHSEYRQSLGEYNESHDSDSYFRDLIIVQDNPTVLEVIV